MDLRPLLIALALAGPASAFELPMQQAGSGNYYVHATLNREVETDLLLDTGSGYVTLSRATFSQLEHDEDTVFQRRIIGKMANGKSLAVEVYRIRELRLAEDCVLRDIEVALLPNADRDILGLNALRLIQPFTLQLEPPLLRGSAC